MSAPSRINSPVLIEPALPEPNVLVTTRTAAPNRERGRFFPSVAEGRAFAAELAEQRGLLLVDLIATAEGGAE
ncbi:hypothetical protein SOQ14_00630 [Erythrobacter sp. T5W1-R]|uniref:hypothetical protein n=1 Tax=Erythrobacter sp. T5W1-R TaxID=3101752 RepID=UPI002B003C1E|nr:hypothetical protein [Erythrobacter sp. T5W1-R]MEA1617417.1 hypothetical protein [Erythrobacter sp. T5W1-R]